MSRPVRVLRNTATEIRERIRGLTGQSERTLMLGTILLASAVSAATSYVFAQYYGVDVLSSLLADLPEDCWLDWGVEVGRHCFSDYPLQAGMGMRPNPWEPYPMFTAPDYQMFPNSYPAAAQVPHVIFALLGQWLAAPRLGLFGYMLVLTIAVFTPAVWAARGARGLERVVVFVALGVAAIPVWTVIDRGNSTGFVVPIALVFLVALHRQRWGLVAVMAVVAAVVKPQFLVLVVALFAARQWRLGGMAVAGGAAANIAAYLLWPRNFPGTVVASIHNVLGYGSFQAEVWNFNVSFGKGLLLIPDTIKKRELGIPTVPDGFLAGPRSLLGYVVLALVVISLLALGRRIPPVMTGIVLLATASLFPAMTNRYYLVFVLPIAALVARNPGGRTGSGIFDGLADLGDRRRAVGIIVSTATALTIAQIATTFDPILTMGVPAQMGYVGFIGTTTIVPTSSTSLAPLLWLAACAAIIVSYARRPAFTPRNERRQRPGRPADTAAGPSCIQRLAGADLS